MRTIDRSSAFKRDYKREAKGQHRATLDVNLIPVLMALADDQPLEPRHRDHDLSGEWAGYRAVRRRINNFSPFQDRTLFGVNSLPITEAERTVVLCCC